MMSHEEKAGLLDQFDELEVQYKQRYQYAKRIGDQEEMSKVLDEFDSVEDNYKAAYQDKGSVLENIGQGATLGLADEIGGALAATYGTLAPEAMGGLPAGTDWTDAYAGVRDIMRRNAEASAIRNPKTALAAEVAGGLATGGVGLARSAAAKGTGMLGQRMLQTSKIGAGEGAVAGFGTSEEDTALGLAQDTAIGAGLGGMMGASFAPAADVTSRLVGRVRRKPTHARMVQEAVQQSDIDDIGARMREMGPEATFADVAGTPGKTFAQGVVAIDKTPKARTMAESAFGARAAGVQARTRAALREATGVDTRYLDASDEVEDQLRSQADELYGIAYSDPNFDPFDQKLMEYINRPGVRRELRGVVDDAANEGRSLPQLENIILQGDDVRVSKDMMPDMESWDAIKRRLDAGVRQAAQSSDKSYSSLKTLRNQVRGRLEELNPAYAKAKAIFRENAEVRDAMDEGLKFLQRPTRDIAREVRGMNEAQRNNYVVGMVEAVTEKIRASTPGEMANFKFLEAPNVREKLMIALQDAGKVNKLMNRISAERAFQETRNAVTRGSETAMRGQAGNVLRSGISAPTSKTEAVERVISKVLDSVTRLPQREIDKISEILFTSGNVKQVEMALHRAGVRDQLVQKTLQVLSRAGMIASPAAVQQATSAAVGE